MGATGLVLKLHFLTEIKRLEEKMRVFGGTARDRSPNNQEKGIQGQMKGRRKKKKTIYGLSPCV